MAKLLLLLLLLLQAQGEALIRKALSELKLWGLQRTFSFVPSKDSNASTAAASASAGKSAAAGGGAGGSRPVQLIKEWSEVLSELGNHQSLVASLKTSHYHHLFKVRSSFLSLSFFMGCYAS
jgi:dynein heavy chain 2